MSRALATAATAALLVGLGGCGAASTGVAQAAPVASKSDALKTAAQGRATALLAGDIPGFLAYAHADCKSDADQGSDVLGVGEAHRMANGATLTIDSVVLDGDRGRIGDWHLSPGAPDALRRALKASAATQSASMPWRYVGDEWYFRSTDCTGGT